MVSPPALSGCLSGSGGQPPPRAPHLTGRQTHVARLSTESGQPESDAHQEHEPGDHSPGRTPHVGSWHPPEGPSHAHSSPDAAAASCPSSRDTPRVGACLVNVNPAEQTPAWKAGAGAPDP